MLAPALSSIGADLQISEAEASMALSIYVLAFAFGPMVLAPCSEVWGRRPIWIVGAAWYVLFNTLCGLATSRGVLITGRLMAGLGASAEFAVDMFCQLLFLWLNLHRSRVQLWQIVSIPMKEENQLQCVHFSRY